MKLNAFVTEKLKEVVEEFEYQIIETFGSVEFIQTYHAIFGTEYPPNIPFDIEEEIDEEAARRNMINAINALKKPKVMKGIDYKDVKAAVISQNPGQSTKQPMGRVSRGSDPQPMRRQARGEPSDE